MHFLLQVYDPLRGGSDGYMSSHGMTVTSNLGDVLTREDKR